MLSRRAVVQLASPLRRALSTTRPLGNDSPISVEKPELSKPKQAPNQPTTWTASQRLRPGLGSSPRFEQTNIDLQPNPLSAMELVSQEPVRVVDGRKAVCDGGACLATFTCRWKYSMDHSIFPTVCGLQHLHGFHLNYACNTNLDLNNRNGSIDVQ